MLKRYLQNIYVTIQLEFCVLAHACACVHMESKGQHVHPPKSLSTILFWDSLAHWTWSSLMNWTGQTMSSRDPPVSTSLARASGLSVYTDAGDHTWVLRSQ